MEVEKNYLAEHAYPELRAYAQRRGLDLRIVDIAIATDLDNQRSIDYKLRQLRNCQKSAGPNFVLLLGDRYGPSLLPTSLTEEEHTSLCKVAHEHLLEDSHLLKEYYALDTNEQIPTMKLQVGNLDDKLCQKMRKLMRDAVKLAVQTCRVREELADIIRMSALDMETRQALSTDAPQRQCLCFHRQLLGIRNNLADPNVAQHTDLTTIKGETVLDTSSWTQHENLLSFVQKTVGETNVKEYPLTWEGTEVCEEKQEDLEYLRSLSADFVEGVTHLIDVNNPPLNVKPKNFALYEEVLPHAKIWESHMKHFVGRAKELSLVGQMMRETKEGVAPLVIHGEPGVGKSSLVAAVAEKAKEFLGKDAAVVLRFLGSFPRSSRLRDLLVDVCEQVSVIYKDYPICDDDKLTVDRIVRVFQSQLQLVSRHHAEKKPLVIVIDELEQLDPTDRAFTFFWLPKICPPNVHLVLTLRSSCSSLMSSLESRLQNSKKWIKLDTFTFDDAKLLVDSVLNTNSKILTPLQKATIDSILSENTHPFFVQELALESFTWTSDLQVDPSYIPTTIEDRLIKFLCQLEDELGENLVRETIFYLSFLQYGISEVELRDVLSMLPVIHTELMEDRSGNPRQQNYATMIDNNVTSVLDRLRPWISSSKVHNKTLLHWKHDLLRKIVEEIYIGTNEFEFKKNEAYVLLSELFKQQDGISKTFDGELTECGVMPQYLLLCNIRKLEIEPFVLSKSGAQSEIVLPFKEDIACNFTWLLTSLQAKPTRSICETLALVDHRDPDLNITKQLIKLASPGLLNDPNQLAPQILGILGWLSKETYPRVNQLVQEAQNWVETCADPLIVPLLHCFPDAADLCISKLRGLTEIMALDNDTNLAIVKNKDGFVEVWDLVNEELSFSTGVKFDKVYPNVFVSGSKILGINAPHDMSVFDSATGETLCKVSLDTILSSNVSSMICLCYSSGFELVVLHLSDDDFKQSVVVIDTKKSKILSSITSFDVKDEVLPNSAVLVANDTQLVLVKARSEIVNEDTLQTSDFVTLRVYDIQNGNPIHTFECGECKVHCVMKDATSSVIVSWKDCSFDTYDVINGRHSSHFNAPEDSLQIEECSLTNDGYLVVLGHCLLNNEHSQPHYGLWFWSLSDNAAAELFTQPITDPALVPKHYLILEDLRLVVVAILELGVVNIWDLPTSSLVHSLQVHTSGPERLIRGTKPYHIYTCSNSEKVVKLWDLYDLVVQDNRRDSSINFEESMSIALSEDTADGILRKCGFRQTEEQRPKSVHFAEDIFDDSDVMSSEMDDISTHIETDRSLLDSTRDTSLTGASSDIDVEADTSLSATSPSSSLDQSFLINNYGSRERQHMQKQLEFMFDVTSLAFTKDGRYIVAGYSNRPPVTWSTSDGLVCQTMTAHHDTDISTDWVRLARSDELVVGLTKSKVQPKGNWPELLKYQVWWRETGEPLESPTEDVWVTTAEVAADGERVVLVTLDYYDPDGVNKSGSSAFELVVKIMTINPHSLVRQFKLLSAVVPRDLQVTEDLQFAITSTPDTSYPAIKHLMVMSLDTEPGKEPTINTYNYRSGKKHKKYGATINCLLHNALSIATGLNGDVQLWDITNCGYEGNLYHDPTEKDTNNPSLHNHGGKVIVHMSVSHDRRYLLLGGADGVASVWDLDNEVMLFSYKAHQGSVVQVIMSEDNQLVVTSGDDCRLCVWQFGSVDSPVCELYIHVAPHLLLLSNDKQTIAALGAQQNEKPRLMLFRFANVKEPSQR